MNKTLKETREMKDSGIEWIGEIPKTWQLPLLGSHFKERSEKVNDKDFPPLSVTKKGVVPQLENVAKTDNNDNRKKICINDFVINSRSDRKGSSGLSKYEGSTSNISIVLQLKDIFPMYAHYLLKSHGFIEEFYRWGSGIVADLWSTRYSSMKKINIPLPPLYEQQAIANYLDKQVGKINDLIAEQKQAIENWKAYKQSLVTETVTKGLNPDVEMKDSGIEWIGEIPSHWEIAKVKHLYEVSLGKMLQNNPKNEDDIYVPYLRSANIYWNGLDLTDVRKMWVSQTDKVKYELTKGDLIVSEGGDIGVACFWDGSIDECYIQNALHRVRGYDVNNLTYLYYWLFAIKHNGYLDLVCNKISIAHFTKEKFMNTPILKIPLLEQQQIANYLDKKCSKIDQTIEQKQALIKQLEEYKQSLIYECVTGKRCVL